jgi:hypothetical protein
VEQPWHSNILLCGSLFQSPTFVLAFVQKPSTPPHPISIYRHSLFSPRLYHASADGPKCYSPFFRGRLKPRPIIRSGERETGSAAHHVTFLVSDSLSVLDTTYHPLLQHRLSPHRPPINRGGALALPPHCHWSTTVTASDTL